MSLVFTNQVYGLRARQNIGPVVSNTTAETDLVNVAIPANFMGTSRVLTFDSTSLITTPALAIPTLTLTVRFGTSVIATASSLALAIGQSNSPFRMSGFISLDDVANAQTAITSITMGGTGLPLVLTGTQALQVNALTEDTTVALNFRITAQFGGLSSTTSIQQQFTQVVIS